jgi:hypothetical protein
MHWLTPIGNIIFNSMLYQIPIAHYCRALFYTGNRIDFGMIVFVPLIAGTCIYLTKRWSFILYILVMCFPIIYTSLKWYQNPSGKVGLSVLSLYLVNILVVSYFMLPTVRKIYFDPRLRWWETKPRYLTDFVANLLVSEPAGLTGHVKNISVGGLYVETEAELELHKQLQIFFKYGDQEINIKAEPVFRRSIPPAGYGFQVSREETKKSQLRKVVRSLKHNSAVVQGRAPTPEDSFWAWLRQIFHRSAWIPQIK